MISPFVCMSGGTPIFPIDRASRSEATEAQRWRPSQSADNRHADTVLSLLACIPLLKRDATPLEMWMYSIFEERAMGREGDDSQTGCWRDAFIASALIHLELEKRLSGLLAHRNR